MGAPCICRLTIVAEGTTSPNATHTGLCQAERTAIRIFKNFGIRRRNNRMRSQQRLAMVLSGISPLGGCGRCGDGPCTYRNCFSRNGSKMRFRPISSIRGSGSVQEKKNHFSPPSYRFLKGGLSNEKSCGGDRYEKLLWLSLFMVVLPESQCKRRPFSKQLLSLKQRG